MKDVLITIGVILGLMFIIVIAVNARTDTTGYEKMEDYKVGGFTLYIKDRGNDMCTISTDNVIYVDEDGYSYYFTEHGCDLGNTRFIKFFGIMMSIERALNFGLLSIEEVEDADLPGFGKKLE